MSYSVFTRSTTRRMLLALLATLALLPQLALADLMLYPTRIVFEKNQRTTQVDLVNNGTEAATYRITLVNRRMSESGELQPAGEAATPVIAQASGFSKTRAQVKQETRAARANGMLLPAGEGMDEPSQVADVGGVASATAARQAA